MSGQDDSPVAQSLRIGFGGLRLAMLGLFAYWATSNMRTVPPDSQAVVLRFGAVVAAREAGLVLAWPRPFENVVLVPSGQRQLRLAIDGGATRSPAVMDPASRAGQALPPRSAALDLTRDGGAVLLDSTLFYRVSDPRAFWLSEPHIGPALRRLYLAAAAAVMARSQLNDVMAVQSDGQSGAAASALRARREALRGALVDETNRRLAGLEVAGASLGVVATRVDVAAYLPPAAKNAFDAVLEASQLAEQGLAAARTSATRAEQKARQEADNLVAAARASADERLSVARTQAATLGAMVSDAGARPALIDQVYRERMAAILHAAASVSTVDPRTDHLILPGHP
ncbi:MAG: SPFH domain-containing protein [Acetobacteraceae bacterium]|nr:SPFH domain-containing protein [Acetobacteraceae bacterium]